MNITADQTICGLPAVEARDAARTLFKFTPASHLLLLGELTAAGVADPQAYFDEALRSNLLELDPAGGGSRLAGEPSGTGVYTLTIAGVALAKATTRKQMARATADRTFAAVLAAVDEVNADDECPYVVVIVDLFGSMLDSDRTHVSDVDVRVVVTPRDEARFDAMHQARIDAAYAAGRSFSTVVDQVGWPEIELRRRLRGRRRVDLQVDFRVPDQKFPTEFERRFELADRAV